jgi:hypothetical protein
MKIEGEAAAQYEAVRLDSFATVNRGVLVSADDDTGKVVWLDKTANQREVTLGSHAIRIMRKAR